MFSAFGETRTAREWAQHPRCVVPFGTLDWRLRQGWDPETALTAPPNTRRAGVTMLTAYSVTKPLTAWLDDPRCAVSINTIKARLADGWTAEAALSTPANTGRGRRGTPLTDEQAAELWHAVEQVRQAPRVQRHTPADAPERAAIQRRDELIRAAIARGTTIAGIARTTGLRWATVAAVRDDDG